MSVLFPLQATGGLDTPTAQPQFKSVAGDGNRPLDTGCEIFSSEQVFSPLMLIKQSAIQHNQQALAAWCREQGVLLAAHGKTSMSAAVLRQAVAAGAWGLSAATPAQVRALRSFGVRNVFLANELVDAAGIRWIGEWQRQHPDHQFLCYVDSLKGVALLDRHLAASGVTLSVLVEVSQPGGRTGCRTADEALAIAQAVQSSAHLSLVGVAGYEGAIAAGRDEAALTTVRHYCQKLSDIATMLADNALFTTDTPILSAGGGAYFDVVVSSFKAANLPQPPVILIRAGAYMAHDDGLYARIAPFAQPNSPYQLHSALEIWGRVLSRPEPGLALLDFGRRDVPFDQDMPIPHAIRNEDGSAPRKADGMHISDVNDQHAYLRVPESDPLAPGDWVGCGISHPCTAFDKWRYLPLVDDHYRVTDAAYTAF